MKDENIFESDEPKKRNACRSFFRLFRNIFVHETEMDERIVYGLRTRAWIIFSSSILYRIGEIIN